MSTASWIGCFISEIMKSKLTHRGSVQGLPGLDYLGVVGTGPYGPYGRNHRDWAFNKCILELLNAKSRWFYIATSDLNSLNLLSTVLFLVLRGEARKKNPVAQSSVTGSKQKILERKIVCVIKSWKYYTEVVLPWSNYWVAPRRWGRARGLGHKGAKWLVGALWSKLVVEYIFSDH